MKGGQIRLKQKTQSKWVAPKQQGSFFVTNFCDAAAVVWVTTNPRLSAICEKKRRN